MASYGKIQGNGLNNGLKNNDPGTDPNRAAKNKIINPVLPKITAAGHGYIGAALGKFPQQYLSRTYTL